MVVTELCDGGDLAKAIWQHRYTKAMNWYTRGAKLSLDVASGLAYLHSRNVSQSEPRTLQETCTLPQPIMAHCLKVTLGELVMCSD